MIMSGLFERIARRRATPPDETREVDTSAVAASAAAGGEPAHTDAPADGDDPTTQSQGEALAGAATDHEAPTVQSDALAGAGGEAEAAAEHDAPTVQSDAPAPSDAGVEATATAEHVTVADGEAARENEAAAAEPEPDGPSFRERGRVRRRVRYLRRVRELQLRDLGGLVFELRRFGREREDLVGQKLEQLAATDDELRGLETVLDDRRAIVELREPGVGGTCPNCGALHGSADHFCAQCGRPLTDDPIATDAPPTAASEQPNGAAPAAEASAEQAAPDGSHVA